MISNLHDLPCGDYWQKETEIYQNDCFHDKRLNITRPESQLIMMGQ